MGTAMLKGPPETTHHSWSIGDQSIWMTTYLCRHSSLKFIPFHPVCLFSLYLALITPLLCLKITMNSEISANSRAMVQEISQLSPGSRLPFQASAVLCSQRPWPSTAPAMQSIMLVQQMLTSHWLFCIWHLSMGNLQWRIRAILFTRNSLSHSIHLVLILKSLTQMSPQFHSLPLPTHTPQGRIILGSHLFHSFFCCSSPCIVFSYSIIYYKKIIRFLRKFTLSKFIYQTNGIMGDKGGWGQGIWGLQNRIRSPAGFSIVKGYRY